MPSGISRKNSVIEEAISILDVYFEEAGGDTALAFSKLDHHEIAFIEEELQKCLNFRYYAENYHAIGSEAEGLKTLYPFWDSQEIFYEHVHELQRQNLPVKILVLKARQLGLSTICEALIFHRTIFTPACNSLVVAQDPGQADYLFGMSRTAYDSLPWWMRPENRYEAKGRYLIFDRRNPTERMIYPGLRSQIFVEAANKMTGVAIGKTIRSAHLSELSAWPYGGEILAEQIFPTMNAPDELAIMESTARGRNNFWHDFWCDAMEGKVDWIPVFIEFFRVKKYSMPIPPALSFNLNEEEKSIQEKVAKSKGITITNEQFYWRRKKMEEFASLQGDEFKFFQEYPSVSWMEAFQGSGICAFSKRKLQSILETTCCDPLWYGEINLEEEIPGRGHWVPKVKLKETKRMLERGERLPAQEQYGGRLYVWEIPEEGQSYYIAADVAHGVAGGDYSCACINRIGHRGQPDVQVAEWHGWINPTPYAYVLAALGYWYNEGQIVVECNDVGNATNSHLMRVIEYPNLFRWKHYDKIRNFMTDWMGWFTNSKTRDLIIAKFREALDEGSLIIRSDKLVDECLDFSSIDDSRFEGQSGKDDRVFAAMICNFCSHDSDWGLEAAMAPDKKEEREKGKDFINTDYSPVWDEGRRDKVFSREEREVPKDYTLYEEMEHGSEDWKLF